MYHQQKTEACLRFCSSCDLITSWADWFTLLSDCTLSVLLVVLFDSYLHVLSRHVCLALNAAGDVLLWMHIYDNKLCFDIVTVGNVQNIFMEHDLNILMIFGMRYTHELVWALLWISDCNLLPYETCVCVRARERESVCVCVHVCVRVRVREYERERERVPLVEAIHQVHYQCKFIPPVFGRVGHVHKNVIKGLNFSHYRENANLETLSVKCYKYKDWWMYVSHASSCKLTSQDICIQFLLLVLWIHIK